MLSSDYTSKTIAWGLKTPDDRERGKKFSLKKIMTTSYLKWDFYEKRIKEAVNPLNKTKVEEKAINAAETT